jgi:hypothetical protein
MEETEGTETEGTEITVLHRGAEKRRESRGGHRALLHVFTTSRVHQTLRVTPATEAGVPNHVWSIEETVALLT